MEFFHFIPVGFSLPITLYSTVVASASLDSRLIQTHPSSSFSLPPLRPPKFTSRPVWFPCTNPKNLTFPPQSLSLVLGSQLQFIKTAPKLTTFYSDSSNVRFLFHEIIF
ncbi:SRSF protein kinase 2 [Platysternon megacephalum]|uniref:SRSF protein kinase 2 n=1 Tax=Platysternon megacephalum TaxID=55544 RepID=A0A4D9EJM8_9SAUR|nr:SRSF protein kinase 2 [Platysternon megacephalum]